MRFFSRFILFVAVFATAGCSVMPPKKQGYGFASASQKRLVAMKHGCGERVEGGIWAGAAWNGEPYVIDWDDEWTLEFKKTTYQIAVKECRKSLGLREVEVFEARVDPLDRENYEKLRKYKIFETHPHRSKDQDIYNDKYWESKLWHMRRAGYVKFYGVVNEGGNKCEKEPKGGALSGGGPCKPLQAWVPSQQDWVLGRELGY